MLNLVDDRIQRCLSAVHQTQQGIQMRVVAAVYLSGSSLHYSKVIICTIQVVTQEKPRRLGTGQQKLNVDTKVDFSPLASAETKRLFPPLQH